MPEVARVSQAVVEYATATSAETRVSQFVIEYIRVLPPPPPEQPFEYVATNIVRVRRAPHLADENQRLFYSKFQLDCEVGLGTTTGQGSTPTLELRWSDDGGRTFGKWRTLGVGPLGHYQFRAIAYQLGFSRDRIFEVRMSDPVPCAWLDAYLDFEEGS